MIAKSPAFALAALAVLALAGCGKQGELERPRPLVGHGVEPNAVTRTRQAAEARARTEGARNTDPQAPQSAQELRNRDARLPPPPPPVTGSQLAGTQPSPNPRPPPGGLPDPLQPATVPQ